MLTSPESAGNTVGTPPTRLTDSTPGSDCSKAGNGFGPEHLLRCFQQQSLKNVRFCRILSARRPRVRPPGSDCGAVQTIASNGVFLR